MPRDAQGNPVHSFGRGKLNDEMRKPTSPSVTPKSRPAGHQPDPDAEMHEESPEDIHDVVKEHGPAEEIHMKHDHEAGIHQVTSHHGEFKHHSTHGSHHEAHAHAGKALGMDAEHQD